MFSFRSKKSLRLSFGFQEKDYLAVARGAPKCDCAATGPRGRTAHPEQYFPECYFLSDRFSVIGMYQSYSSFQGLRYGRESI
jgi:hypothetical protein